MTTLNRCAPCAGARSGARRSIARRRAFTLVEILIVVVILGILAAMIYPPYANLAAESRAKTAATNVQKIRGLIEIHANSGDYPLSTGGFPDDIYAEWFMRDILPENPWAGEEINVDVVAAGDSDRFPLTKTFNPDNAADASAWYNTDNGCFAMLVPAQNNDAETLALFNTANIANLGNLGDTE